jgi:folate-binding protein YgfZ
LPARLEQVAHSLKELALEGARTATDDEWEAARILAGWPRRAAEIDEKTLVQEVRFDENGGVSYEKGCYTGQETVARLHFRGHTNRDLRGLSWNSTGALTDSRILLGEREVGSVRSVLSLPTGRIALALIRREVETGQVVTAGGMPATVVSLPFPAS